MKIMLTCSLYSSLSSFSSTSASCSLSTASTSLVLLLPPPDGLDRPDDGDGDVLPVFVAVSRVFSIAFAAAALEPSSAFEAASFLGWSFLGSSFFGSSFLASSFLVSSLTAPVAPMERTLATLGFASPPMVRTFAPLSLVCIGLFRSDDTACGSVGRLAMVGAGFADGCCDAWGRDCCVC